MPELCRSTQVCLKARWRKLVMRSALRKLCTQKWLFVIRLSCATSALFGGETHLRRERLDRVQVRPHARQRGAGESLCVGVLSGGDLLPEERNGLTVRADLTLDVGLVKQAAGEHFDYLGFDIFYRMEGSGPPLLLIHGYPFNTFDWAPIWPTLTERFTVIAPDMMGMGFSAKSARRLIIVESWSKNQLSSFGS